MLTASAVRQRCGVIGQLGLDRKTAWFTIEPGKIDACADLVADICLQNYPDLDIPLHSRWRHFVVDGTDLWAYYRDKSMQNVDVAAVSRSAIDLVFISVLMDAGAGPNWRYTDPVTTATLSRSEGLAAASVDLFFNHLARFDHDLGWYTDAESLMALSLDELAQAMQYSPANPVVGIVGRLQLLNGLGKVLSNTPDNTLTRPGDLLDIFQCRCNGDALPAETILVEVLNRFGTIWPNGLVHHQFFLGDAGYHRQLRTADITDQIVPFHKLSQWLSYSLIEPLQWGWYPGK